MSLRVRRLRDQGFAVPLQPCRALGFVYIKPAVRLPVGGETTLIVLSCPRCVPPWFIEHMPADRPPFLQAGWGPDDRSLPGLPRKDRLAFPRPDVAAERRSRRRTMRIPGIETKTRGRATEMP
jgi:hypothetical protein